MGHEPTDENSGRATLEEAPQPDGPEAAPPAALDLAFPKLFLNRELCLLRFQQRVLEEALDEAHPVVERAKFLAIVGSNMDEFFMVRVAGLKQQVAAGVLDLSADGATPDKQLAEVRKAAGALMDEAYACLHGSLLPALREQGISVLGWNDLDEGQREAMARYFQEDVFPVLTPLAVDPGRPFPHISNLSLNLAIRVRDPGGEVRFVRLKVPDTLPRLVPLKPSSGATRKNGTVPKKHYFVWLEQVIAANLGTLFPGLEVLEAHPFRVTRDAEVAIQELEADDLLETIEEGVRRRRFGGVVRLEVVPEIPLDLLRFLVSHLELDARDVQRLAGPLGLSALRALASISRRKLLHAPFLPVVPPALADGTSADDPFAAIRRGDILLHHPFESFEPVVDLLHAAARDPDVLAIKITLYRVGRNSPVVRALLEANENRKQVAVLVELKARFDEESNIGWAKALEREGVHVVYGLLGLKTHSKVALIVRREGDRIRRYVHLATGNYNPTTARLYTDLGLLTCDEAIGADASDLFNVLTGGASKDDYRKLLVAPINLRRRLEELIGREIRHAQGGGEGHLIVKVNSLVDEKTIRLLYEASRAGVRVDLLVRGMCCLRPGVPGLSDRITVGSIVGRFLEHSRIYWFQNGGAEEVYLGSADLMPRNLNRRVEVLFPVESPALVRHLRDVVLETYLRDNVRARRMQPDGSYVRLRPGEGETPLDSQQRLLELHGSLTER
ncbi:MAG: polyphosphate kinase 1 [Deltaproteobacteria bacterium]|nr:polyphosphate kinase 1 [Deltaproteobacteria bacterium]